jgi:hypothetical protein
MSPAPATTEIAEAVVAFNARYHDMEEALWCVSKSVRPALITGQATEGLETLVWTVKSWWGVQGVTTETKGLAARALAEMDWEDAMFAEEFVVTSDSVKFALDRVWTLTTKMMDLGVKRQEFSLASKVMHWLMPWTVSPYDSFVRKSHGILERTYPRDAYREILAWQLKASERLLLGGDSWIGDVNPRSPLRALDKYLWWRGGGDAGTAAQVRDPWKICWRLGLERP